MILVLSFYEGMKFFPIFSLPLIHQTSGYVFWARTELFAHSSEPLAKENVVIKYDFLDQGWSKDALWTSSTTISRELIR